MIAKDVLVNLHDEFPVYRKTLYNELSYYQWHNLLPYIFANWLAFHCREISRSSPLNANSIKQVGEMVNALEERRHNFLSRC